MDPELQREIEKINKVYADLESAELAKEVEQIEQAYANLKISEEKEKQEQAPEMTTDEKLNYCHSELVRYNGLRDEYCRRLRGVSYHGQSYEQMSLFYHLPNRMSNNELISMFNRQISEMDYRLSVVGKRIGELEEEKRQLNVVA